MEYKPNLFVNFPLTVKPIPNKPTICAGNQDFLGLSLPAKGEVGSGHPLQCGPFGTTIFTAVPQARIIHIFLLVISFFKNIAPKLQNHTFLCTAIGKNRLNVQNVEDNFPLCLQADTSNFLRFNLIVRQKKYFS